MKTRIITGVSAAVFAIGCLVVIGFGYVKYISFIAALFSGIAAYEVMKVSKCKNKVLTACSILFAVAYCPYRAFGLDDIINIPVSVILMVYVLAMLVIMLKWYDKTRFEHVALSLFASITVPASLYSIVGIVEVCDANPLIFQRSHAVFVILIAMFAAWLSDTFAYFFGSRFGKHKLSPKISPKKSVEGAIAGVVGTTLFGIATYFICDRFYFRLDTFNAFSVALITAALCVLGMLGDLSASVIKRNYGEKDFGTIFPGHGGVLDRVDSFLFTIPSAYIIVLMMEALSK